MKMTSMEQDAARFVEREAILDLKAAGFTVIRAGAQSTQATADQWKLAYDPDYRYNPDDLNALDSRAYAGYIFREVGGHAQKIPIPDEAAAQQIALWLNQRDALLALVEDWHAALHGIKELAMEPALPQVELAMGI